MAAHDDTLLALLLGLVDTSCYAGIIWFAREPKKVSQQRSAPPCTVCPQRLAWQAGTNWKKREEGGCVNVFVFCTVSRNPARQGAAPAHPALACRSDRICHRRFNARAKMLATSLPVFASAQVSEDCTLATAFDSS